MPRSNPELAIAMGQRLSEVRNARGLTQEAVAEQAGIAYQQYNKAENGRVCLGSDSLLRICQVLQVSADYLLTGTCYGERFPDISAVLARMSDPQLHAAKQLLQCLSEFPTEK